MLVVDVVVLAAAIMVVVVVASMVNAVVAVSLSIKVEAVVGVVDVEMAGGVAVVADAVVIGTVNKGVNVVVGCVAVDVAVVVAVGCGAVVVVAIVAAILVVAGVGSKMVGDGVVNVGATVGVPAVKQANGSPAIVPPHTPNSSKPTANVSSRSTVFSSTTSEKETFELATRSANATVTMRTDTSEGACAVPSTSSPNVADDGPNDDAWIFVEAISLSSSLRARTRNSLAPVPRSSATTNRTLVPLNRIGVGKDTLTVLAPSRPCVTTGELNASWGDVGGVVDLALKPNVIASVTTSVACRIIVGAAPATRTSSSVSRSSNPNVAGRTAPRQKDKNETTRTANIFCFN